MTITRNGFSGALVAAEIEGVDLTLLTVSAGNNISAEIEDFQNPASTKCALQIIRQTIENFGFNILGQGPLQGNANFTVLVRTDSVQELGGTSTVADLQTAIQAADTAHRGNTPGITADISGATVAIKALYSTT